MKALVLYFSRSGENYVNGRIVKLPVGNTEVVARMIRERIDADLFRIESCLAYADDYSSCIEEALRDKKCRARPELRAYPADLDRYDTIFLGYPNWWGTMPMPVFTLLEHCDLAGKTIRPFCTHEGSGLGTSVGDLKKACPAARVTDGLALHGAHVAEAGAALDRWLGL